MSDNTDKATTVANNAMNLARKEGATTVIVMVAIGNAEAYYVSYYGNEMVVSGLAEIGAGIIRTRDIGQARQNAIDEIEAKARAEAKATEEAS